MYRIRLPRPPSVNSCYATNWNTRRRFVSKKYEEWLELAAENPMTIPTTPLDRKVVIVYRFGRVQDKRRRDLLNYEKPLTDFLVKSGFIADDSLIDYATICWCDEVEDGWVEATIQERDEHVQQGN